MRGYDAARPLEAREWEALQAHATLAAVRFTTTRITDFYLRTGVGERVYKDYRRFLQRLDAVTADDPATFARRLGD